MSAATRLRNTLLITLTIAALYAWLLMVGVEQVQRLWLTDLPTISYWSAFRLSLMFVAYRFVIAVGQVWRERERAPVHAPLEVPSQLISSNEKGP